MLRAFALAFMLLSASQGFADSSPELVPFSAAIYEKPQHVPNKICDVHTSLDIQVKGTKTIAVLQKIVLGYCEIYVSPNKREYLIEEIYNQCGSTYLNGIGVGSTRITIEDHRLRVCEDMKPDSLIVKETTANGSLAVQFGKVQF
jgi:hypothetical protein